MQCLRAFHISLCSMLFAHPYLSELFSSTLTFIQSGIRSLNQIPTSCVIPSNIFLNYHYYY